MAHSRRLDDLTRVRRLRALSLFAAGLVPPIGIVAIIAGSVISVGNYLRVLAIVSVVTLLLPCAMLAVAWRANQVMNRRYKHAAEQVSADLLAHGVTKVGEMPGWKVAEMTGQAPQLTGLTGATYHPVDTMECLAELGHESPQLDCTCGFHAFWDVAQAHRAWRAHRNTALLLVEGYGTVIEHEDGWRAQRQEVLQVVLPPRCSWCRRAADGVASSPNEDLWQVSCQRCGSRWNRFFLDLPALRAAWQTEVRVYEGSRLPRVRQWWRTLGGPGL